MIDLILIGVGPVNLTSAAELARHGLSSRIIDIASHPTTTSWPLASRSVDFH